jgi:hypothetical protein
VDGATFDDVAVNGLEGAVLGASVGKGVRVDRGAGGGDGVGFSVGLNANNKTPHVPLRQSRRDCGPVSAQFQYAPGVGVNSSVLSVSCVGRP